MSMQENRRRYHHGDLRPALVSGARRMLETGGARGLTLRALAAEVGVSQPALYRHFAGKDDLLQAVADAGFTDFGCALRSAIQGMEDPRARLQAAGATYVRYAAANPEWFRLWSSRDQSEARGGRPEAREMGFGVVAPVYEALAELVPPDDSRYHPLFRALWGLAHGLSGLVVERGFQLVERDEERIEAAESAIAAFVELLPPSTSPGSHGSTRAVAAKSCTRTG